MMATRVSAVILSGAEAESKNLGLRQAAWSLNPCANATVVGAVMRFLHSVPIPASRRDRDSGRNDREYSQDCVLSMSGP